MAYIAAAAADLNAATAANYQPRGSGGSRDSGVPFGRLGGARGCQVGRSAPTQTSIVPPSRGLPSAGAACRAGTITRSSAEFYGDAAELAQQLQPWATQMGPPLEGWSVAGRVRAAWEFAEMKKSPHTRLMWTAADDGDVDRELDIGCLMNGLFHLVGVPLNGVNRGGRRTRSRC